MFGELIQSGDGFVGFVGDVDFDIEIELAPIVERVEDPRPDFVIQKKTLSRQTVEIGSASWREKGKPVRRLAMKFDIGGRRWGAKAITKAGERDKLTIVFKTG